MTFEPVSFADYKHDMDELGRTAADVAEAQASRIRELENIMWGMVRSAGGTITVRNIDIARGKPGNWKIESFPADDAVTFAIG